MQKYFFLLALLRPRATWNEVGLYLRWKGRFTQTGCVAETLVAFFACLFAVLALLLRRISCKLFGRG